MTEKQLKDQLGILSKNPIRLRAKREKKMHSDEGELKKENSPVHHHERHATITFTNRIASRTCASPPQGIVCSPRTLFPYIRFFKTSKVFGLDPFPSDSNVHVETARREINKTEEK